MDVIKNILDILKESELKNKELYVSEISGLKNSGKIHSYLNPEAGNISPFKYMDYLNELSFKRCLGISSQMICTSNIIMNENIYELVSGKFAVKTLRMMKCLIDNLNEQNSEKIKNLLKNNSLLFVEENESLSFNITYFSWKFGTGIFKVYTTQKGLSKLRDDHENGTLKKNFRMSKI